VNVLITQVKKELKKLDKEHIAEIGVKRCWFIDSYEVLVGWLQLFGRETTNLKPENQCTNIYLATILPLCTPHYVDLND